MDPFLANAEEILQAAAGCAHAGRRPTGWTILLGAGGEIEMLAAEGWDLDQLRRERGAAMAFRVAEAEGRIAVEGRAGTRACRLESESPAAVARGILNARASIHPAVRFAGPGLPAAPAITAAPTIAATPTIAAVPAARMLASPARP